MPQCSIVIAHWLKAQTFGFHSNYIFSYPSCSPFFRLWICVRHMYLLCVWQWRNGGQAAKVKSMSWLHHWLRHACVMCWHDDKPLKDEKAFQLRYKQIYNTHFGLLAEVCDCHNSYATVRLQGSVSLEDSCILIASQLLVLVIFFTLSHSESGSLSSPKTVISNIITPLNGYYRLLSSP